MKPKNAIVWIFCLGIVVLLMSTGIQAKELTEVNAVDILKQIEKEEDIYLENVCITGELNLSKIELKTTELGIKVVESKITIKKSVVEDDVDFSDTQFNNTLDFYGTAFSGGTNFSRAGFTGNANFLSASFSGAALFRKAHFEGAVLFRRASFSDVSFSGATFFGPADFNEVIFDGTADFSSVLFFGDAYFKSASFSGDAYFDFAFFWGDAEFTSALFFGDAYFKYAYFSGDAYFDFAFFWGDAYFDFAFFWGDASFNEESFRSDAYFNNTFYSEQKKKVGLIWWLPIIPAIIAVLIISKLYLSSKKKEKRYNIVQLVNSLKTLEEKLSALEAVKSTGAIGKDFIDRLSKIEEITAPLKEGPKLSSPEYSLLQYQINKLTKVRENLQNQLERMIERNFNSFRSGYTIWMLIITLLFTLAIGLLIYFLPK